MSEVVAQRYLGTLTNKDLVRDWVIDNVKAATKILAGQCTVLDPADNALGRIVTTDAQPAASVRVSEVDADNTTGVLGDKKIETFKSGAICVLKAGGDIKPGEDFQSAADGEVIVLPAGQTADAETGPEAYDRVDLKLGNCLGKINTVIEVGIDPAAVADGELLLGRLY